MPVSEGVGDSRVGLKDTEICRLPKATEGQVLIRGTEKWEAGDDCAYFEQVVPVGNNLRKTLTNSVEDKVFLDAVAAQNLISNDDTKVKKVSLHVFGVAVNDYAGANALDCTTETHNQWQAKLGAGSYQDLEPNGQMNDNDWLCAVEGAAHDFHFLFNITSLMTDIDGALSLQLKDGRSKESSLIVTLSIALRILWRI